MRAISGPGARLGPSLGAVVARVIVATLAALLAAPCLAQSPPADPFALSSWLTDQAVLSCGSLTVNGGATVDSLGLATGAVLAEQGHVRSNGDVVLSGHAEIHGERHRRPRLRGADERRRGGHRREPGRRRRAPTAGRSTSRPVLADLLVTNDNASIPLTGKGRDPLSGADHRTFKLNGHDTLTLPAGTYLFDSLTVSWSSGDIGESTTYDSRGLPLAVSRPGLGLLAEMGYDLDGHLVARWVHGEGGRTDATSWVYDASGRLRSRKLPGSATEEPTYNPDNTVHTWKTRLLSHPADGPGVPLIIGYEYASGQRLRARTLENREAFDQGLPEGLAALGFGDELELDPLGRPTTVAHKAAAGVWGTGRDSDSLVQLSLDSYRGLPIEEKVGWWGGTQKLTRGFDARGNPSWVLTPAPFAAALTGGYGFESDLLDRRKRSYAVDGALQQVAAPAFAAQIDWEGFGRLSHVIAGGSLSGVFEGLQWNGPGGRLGGLTVDRPSGALGSFTYQWDAATGFKQARYPGYGAVSDRQAWSFTPMAGARLSTATRRPLACGGMDTAAATSWASSATSAKGRERASSLPAWTAAQSRGAGRAAPRRTSATTRRGGGSAMGASPTPGTGVVTWCRSTSSTLSPQSMGNASATATMPSGG